jgi:hypothetical protein
VSLSVSESPVTVRITGVNTDGENLPAEYFEEGKIIIPADQIPSDSFTITLYDSEGNMKDFQTISSVKDGKDGTLSANVFAHDFSKNLFSYSYLTLSPEYSFRTNR